MKYKQAEFTSTSFNCLYSDCGAFAKQTWTPVYWYDVNPQNQRIVVQIPDLFLAVCDHCNKFSTWLVGKLVHPETTAAPAAHPDTPEEIKEDYEEARGVFQKS